MLFFLKLKKYVKTYVSCESHKNPGPAYYRKNTTPNPRVFLVPNLVKFSTEVKALFLMKALSLKYFGMRNV